MAEEWKFLQKMFDEHKVPELEFQGKCHDCGEEMSVLVVMEPDGKTTISGGALYHMPDVFLKCDKCFEKDPMLRKYQPCDVFSRVVGYYRPVRQWHAGKKEEFKNRKMFNVKEFTDETGK
jgi:hypothetical protein